MGIDSHLTEQRFHAEGTRLIRDDGNDVPSQLLVFQQQGQHPYESHGGGYFPFAAQEEFIEKTPVGYPQCLHLNLAGGYEASQFPAPLKQVLDLLTVIRGPVEGRLIHLGITDRDVKAVTEFPQLGLVQFLLLVRDVLSLSRLTQAIPLHGFGQNDGGIPFVFHRVLIRGIHFLRIMTAAPQFAELIIG